MTQYSTPRISTTAALLLKTKAGRRFLAKNRRWNGVFEGTNESGEKYIAYIYPESIEIVTYHRSGWMELAYYTSDGSPDGTGIRLAE